MSPAGGAGRSWLDRPLRVRLAAAAAGVGLAAAATLLAILPAAVERAGDRVVAAMAVGVPDRGARPAAADVAARAAAAAQVRTEVARARRLALGLGLAALAAALAGAWVLAGRLTRPLQETIGALDAVTAGDLTPRLVNGQVEDEAGLLASALNRSLDSIRETMEAFAANAGELASASAGLAADSRHMRVHAEETSSLSAQVAAASEEADRSIRTVATGIEEMSASISEIAKNASDAARIAASAVQVTDGANAIFVKLGASSVEIGNVLKVITSIAEQTNLLALNATIEAARAGEAGRGFAVVATEVKELARQAARAAEDIAQKIQAIQSDTARATQAIGQIDTTINHISDIQVVIANAVEEQTATAAEVSRNITEVARTSAGIGLAIAGVVKAAQETLEGVRGRDAMETGMAETAFRLRSLVGRFRT